MRIFYFELNYARSVPVTDFIKSDRFAGISIASDSPAKFRTPNQTPLASQTVSPKVNGHSLELDSPGNLMKAKNIAKFSLDDEILVVEESTDLDNENGISFKVEENGEPEEENGFGIDVKETNKPEEDLAIETPNSCKSSLDDSGKNGSDFSNNLEPTDDFEPLSLVLDDPRCLSEAQQNIDDDFYDYRNERLKEVEEVANGDDDFTGFGIPVAEEIANVDTEDQYQTDFSVCRRDESPEVDNTEFQPDFDDFQTEIVTQKVETDDSSFVIEEEPFNTDEISNLEGRISQEDEVETVAKDLPEPVDDFDDFADFSSAPAPIDEPKAAFEAHQTSESDDFGDFSDFGDFGTFETAETPSISLRDSMVRIENKTVSLKSNFFHVDIYKFNSYMCSGSESNNLH